MQLSAHFTRAELDPRGMATDEQLENLKKLASALEYVREVAQVVYGQEVAIKVFSGLRPGGSPIGHGGGCAADIYPVLPEHILQRYNVKQGPNNNFANAQRAAWHLHGALQGAADSSDALKLDQVIRYGDKNTLHIGYRPDGNRGQFFFQDS